MASQQAASRRVVLLLAALIAYGSLYPFEFAWQHVEREQFLAFLTDGWGTRGDVIGNIALFLPYGFVGALSLKGRRRWTESLTLLILAGLVLAVGLQIIQFWIPGRVPALGDAGLNLCGMLAGIVVALPLRERTHGQTWKSELGRLYLSIPMVLVTLWVAYRWFPLVPSLDFQHLKDAFKPLLRNPDLEPVRALHDAVAWLACFHLLKQTPLARLSPFAVSASAISVLLVEPVFVGNHVSVNNVLGLGVALALRPLLARRGAPLLLLLGLFAAIALSGLSPFRLVEPANSFHWLPFAGFLDGSMWVNTASLLEKSFFYGAAVFLLHAEGARWGPAAAIVAIGLALLEAAQVFIAGRTAEITDPVLAILIAYVMSRSGGRAREIDPGARAVPRRSGPSQQIRRQLRS